MRGISSSGKEAIARTIEDIFDKIALQLIGEIPKLKHKKLLIFNTRPNFGLAHLFLQSMSNKTPNPIESDALKSLLTSSYGYIDALKSRTMANVTERIDGLIKEATARGKKATEEEVNFVLADEMSKAKNHMQTIVEAESTKIRNAGALMDISRVASAVGDSDPTVFFVVVRDGETCKECVKLHLMPDGVTPRLWKFSELKQGWHKRGEDFPSAFGLHPHCRCTLTYLSAGFGFDKSGKVAYKSSAFDAYANQ